MRLRNLIEYTVGVSLVAILLASCGLKRHPYENPITKDTQQPDKVLFDKAVNDLEHARYEVARLTLQTLINTYDTSEYLAKAKLAIADSWFREGGAHGLAQAEAEYKDFILFYPQMEESAEAQEKICDIHYKQMEKPDRDTNEGLRASQECKDLLVKFPNSKFVPETQQKLREIQEVLAENEFEVGMFYHSRGSFPAAAGRLQAVSDQYPLFSQNDEALWNLADAYHRMGDRFENQEAAAYAKIVKDYPLSVHADDAKAKLQAMDRPVPEADPTALAREQYDQENLKKKGLPAKLFGPFSTHPDVRMAAKSGAPNMETFQPAIPVSVPKTAGEGSTAPGTSTVGAEVSAAVVNNTNALDQGKDARAIPPAQNATQTTQQAGTTGTGATTQTAAAQPQPLPTNHPVKLRKQKKNKKNQPAANTSAPATSTPAASTPAATTPATPGTQPQP